MMLSLLRWLFILLLLLLRLLHWSVRADLGCLLPEEVVDSVVGLGNDLGCPRFASFVASWGLLLSWSVYKGGQVSGCEVGQLD